MVVDHHTSTGLELLLYSGEAAKRTKGGKKGRNDHARTMALFDGLTFVRSPGHVLYLVQLCEAGATHGEIPRSMIISKFLFPGPTAAADHQFLPLKYAIIRPHYSTPPDLSPHPSFPFLFAWHRMIKGGLDYSTCTGLFNPTRSLQERMKMG